MKGASASRARRRAISVLPTPVGPIIRMFFGVISERSGSATCWRRQRLRSATATARLARSWPTMYLFSSWTISRGVIMESSLRVYATLQVARALAVLSWAPALRAAGRAGADQRQRRLLRQYAAASLERLDGVGLVCVDADV